MDIDINKDLLNSTHLYNHVFDVDDIIRALCGDDHSGKWLLCTKEGKLITETKNANQSSDKSHLHTITPLPVSYIGELLQYSKKFKPQTEQQNKLIEFLKSIDSSYGLLQGLNNETYGEWLYGKLKEEAVEWLDERNMIPPSMVRSSGIGCGKPSNKLKVKIT